MTTDDEKDTDNSCPLKVAKCVATKLSGQHNYRRWVGDVKLVFSAKNGWLEALTDANASSLAVRKTRTALLPTLSPDIRALYEAGQTTKTIFDALEAKYVNASKLKVSIALSDFWGTRLKPDQSISSYIAAKRQLQEVINSSSRSTLQMDEHALRDSVLVGVRSLYNSLVESLGEDSSLTMERLEARLLDAEEARTGVRSSHKADAESARAAIGSDGLSCQHCGKTGHQAVKCWKITPVHSLWQVWPQSALVQVRKEASSKHYRNQDMPCRRGAGHSAHQGVCSSCSRRRS
jgi:hypothetical protein